MSSTDFEASFIRLLDKVTNGSRIEINQTGECYNNNNNNKVMTDMFLSNHYVLSVFRFNVVELKCVHCVLNILNIDVF